MNMNWIKDNWLYVGLGIAIALTVTVSAWVPCDKLGWVALKDLPTRCLR